MTTQRRAMIETSATWAARIVLAVLAVMVARMFTVWDEQAALIDQNHLIIEEHDRRIEVIEATRFTREDGHAMEAAIMAAMRTGWPPDWLRDIVKRTEAGVERNGGKLDSLTERVIRLEERKAP